MDMTQDVFTQASLLPPQARAYLVDQLLATLMPPDKYIEQQWLAEAKDRLAAYDRGELTAIDGEQVFAELRAAR